MANEQALILDRAFYSHKSEWFWMIFQLGTAVYLDNIAPAA